MSRKRDEEVSEEGEAVDAAIIEAMLQRGIRALMAQDDKALHGVNKELRRLLNKLPGGEATLILDILGSGVARDLGLSDPLVEFDLILQYIEGEPGIGVDARYYRERLEEIKLVRGGRNERY